MDYGWFFIDLLGNLVALHGSLSLSLSVCDSPGFKGPNTASNGLAAAWRRGLDRSASHCSVRTGGTKVLTTSSLPETIVDHCGAMGI